jgi:Flp pilus assembly protein TadD
VVARHLAALAVGALVALGPLGCSRRAEPPPDAHARVQAFLEAGNQAYVAGEYALAARRYAAAASLDPREPACYVGLGMALTKLNRGEEARSAYARARELATERRRQGAGKAP